MKIGFTGTQKGMSTEQKIKLQLKLQQLFLEGANEFHHGDCVGADAEACDIAINEGYEIHCHPPRNKYKRAFAPYDIIYPEKEYLERNHEIVNSVNAMIAAPKERTEQLRSGTWATIRYSRKKNKDILVILP